ncbi:MAG: hydrogenase expression/formation protein HypE [Propionibacteriaceae bacterium]|nr:hydrogenase expression/formation protein HypE [Propionibacteriaceae bacterium]
MNQIDRARGRRLELNDDRVSLAHGSGGKAAAALIQAVFIEAFGAPTPGELTDAAILDVGQGRIAYTTDSYVVQPIRFPGASIGELAVNGTVNDLAVSGAVPQWMSVGFILEEGLAIDELRTIVAQMRRAADLAGVRIVTGDTKVVPRGAADQIFINTSGIGVIPAQRCLGASQVRVGDQILLSGPIAAHGMAVMIARGNLAIHAAIESDSAAVTGLVEAMYAAVDPADVRWMRDPTRGGLGTVANELARDTDLGVMLAEEEISVAPEVRGACDMLGIDPFYVANEGCFIAVVAPESAQAAVEALRSAGAPQASIIGEIIDELPGLVAVSNPFGGTRLMDMLVTDPLPRIC